MAARKSSLLIDLLAILLESSHADREISFGELLRRNNRVLKRLHGVIQFLLSGFKPLPGGGIEIVPIVERFFDSLASRFGDSWGSLDVHVIVGLLLSDGLVTRHVRIACVLPTGYSQSAYRTAIMAISRKRD